MLVSPSTKCKLRLLQLQRVYDYLQIENEYIKNRVKAKSTIGSMDVVFDM